MKKLIIGIALAVALAGSARAESDRAMMKTADGSQAVYSGDSIGKLLDIHGRPDYKDADYVYIKTRRGVVRKKANHWYYRIHTGTSHGEGTWRVTVVDGKITRITEMD